MSADQSIFSHFRSRHVQPPKALAVFPYKYVTMEMFNYSINQTAFQCTHQKHAMNIRPHSNKNPLGIDHTLTRTPLEKVTYFRLCGHLPGLPHFDGREESWRQLEL